MTSPVERCVGYVCAASICVTALLVDGVTAQTMAIGVAATLSGGISYAAGRYRKLRDP